MARSGDSDDMPTPHSAGDWLIALREDPDDRLLQARFDRWLAESPDHARDWAEISRTYELIGLAGPRSGGRQGARAARTAASALAFLKARPFAIAAAGALALAALAFAPNALLRLEADHLTTTSQVESIALDDGSTIRLAPKSAVDVAFADDARSVRLLRGQAFFDVARDEERPFRVVAGRVETTVLGTAFDVRLHGDGAEVSVRRGAVRVATLDAIVSEDLEGGDWVRVSWDGEATRGSSPPGEVAAWVDGQFVAKEAAVSEVVEALRPYFDGVILIRGDGLADRRVTGIYRLSDPEAALRAVAEAQDAHVSRLSPWMLVISGS